MQCALVAQAGHALWLFVVQRESVGLRDTRTLMRDYRVPGEVQASYRWTEDRPDGSAAWSEPGCAHGT